MDYERLAERVRRRREELGLTKSAARRRSGSNGDQQIGATTWDALESGVGVHRNGTPFRPTTPTLSKVARALDVTLEEVRGWAGITSSEQQAQDDRAIQEEARALEQRMTEDAQRLAYLRRLLERGPQED